MNKHRRTHVFSPSKSFSKFGPGGVGHDCFNVYFIGRNRGLGCGRVHGIFKSFSSSN
jgi:hypothetical protein